MEETTLLPCPFCGGTAGLFRHGNHGPYVGWLQNQTDNWVACEESPGETSGCGVSVGMFPTEAEAVEAWNRRAPTQPLKVE